MTTLIDNIYYVDKALLEIIENDFELIDDKEWYQLYKNKNDFTYWRLDHWDKYQEQIFVRLNTIDNWTNFNDKELRIELLKKVRGTNEKKCTWINCDRQALNGLVFCERHAFEEMNIRK